MVSEDDGSSSLLLLLLSSGCCATHTHDYPYPSSPAKIGLRPWNANCSKERQTAFTAQTNYFMNIYWGTGYHCLTEKYNTSFTKPSPFKASRGRTCITANAQYISFVIRGVGLCYLLVCTGRPSLALAARGPEKVYAGHIHSSLDRSPLGTQSF